MVSTGCHPAIGLICSGYAGSTTVWNHHADLMLFGIFQHLRNLDPVSRESHPSEKTPTCTAFHGQPVGKTLPPAHDEHELRHSRLPLGCFRVSRGGHLPANILQRSFLSNGRQLDGLIKPTPFSGKSIQNCHLPTIPATHKCPHFVQSQPVSI